MNFQVRIELLFLIIKFKKLLYYSKISKITFASMRRKIETYISL